MLDLSSDRISVSVTTWGDDGQKTPGQEQAGRLITSTLAKAPTPCVVTIGTFDGVHAGHRAVLAAGTREARRLCMPLVALTFDPRPERLFRPDALPDLFASVAERVELLRDCGADHVCVLPFDKEVAALDYQVVVRLIIDTLRAQKLVVGADFALGRGRAGTPERIAGLGLPTLVVPLVRAQTGHKVSSTGLRLLRAFGGHK